MLAGKQHLRSTMTTKELLNLKKDVGFNKRVPAKYQEAILTALAFFPELRKIEIHFRLTDNLPVPCSTGPDMSTVLKPPAQRRYHVTILEKAKEPLKSALFMHLSHECRVGVIAHELGHILKFNSCDTASLLRTLAAFPLPFFKRKLEQGADLTAIEHGLGPELYKHALYVRSIPGYIEKRPEVERYHLGPEAILACLNLNK